MMPDFDWAAIQTSADGLADDLNADVVFLNGDINSGLDHRVITLCKKRKEKRENVLLVLTTPGGDAHVAYKIARYLQRSYKKFSIFAPGWCKSAGTLLAMGAHELIMSDFSELGPLDVQRGKADELWENNSGLIENAAFKALEGAALQMFKDYCMHMKEMSQGRVTFKTASDIAIKMIVGQLQPVYAQLDPLKIGENTRTMQIAEHYGFRLALHSKNLQNHECLEGLVSAYSSHAFVIDREEASGLFVNVSEADGRFEALSMAIGPYARFPIEQFDGEQTIIRYLSKAKPNENQQQPGTEAGTPQQHGGDIAGAASSEATNDPPKVVPINPAREGETGASAA